MDTIVYEFKDNEGRAMTLTVKEKDGTFWFELGFTPEIELKTGELMTTLGMDETGFANLLLMGAVAVGRSE